MKSKSVSLFLMILLVASLAGPLMTGAAEGVAQTDDWEFAIELYLWGASIGGKSASSSDIDVDFDDILDSLESAFMGMGGAHKGKWFFGVDVIYLDTADNEAIEPGVTASVDLTTWIITSLVGYSLVDTGKSRLEILGGVRYLYMDADLRVDASGAHAEDSGSNWDAVIGTKGVLGLTEKWQLFGHLDIGTGDSDLTWQAMAGIGYEFNKWFHVNAAYRYLDWDFDDNPAVDELNISGPALGIKIVF